MNLPEQIRDLRTKRGMTQAQLAEAAGIAQPQISKFEKEIPAFRYSTLQKIAEALDCDIEITLMPKTICDKNLRDDADIFRSIEASELLPQCSAGV